MAELVESMPEGKVEAWSVARPRISWGAIFGGTVSTLGIWLMLYAFGMAVGLSNVDVNDPGGSLKSSGIFTGVWGVFAPLVALFVGGMMAGRLSGSSTRGAGAAHGLVMWGFTTVVGAYMVVTMLGALIGGVAQVGRSALEAGGAAVGKVAQGAADKAGGGGLMGLDADDALAPINQRLKAEGKPPITADQLQAATRDVAQTAVGQGRVDRATLVGALQRNTDLSRADANEIADRVEAQWDRSSAKLKDAAHGAETKALAAAKTTGKAFWGVFGALMLGLGAALGGGALGARGMPHLRRERVAPAPAPAPATRSAVPPHREVYP